MFTGPCFSNAEVFITGKEAVMAWKVTSGSWKGVDLAGLCIAAAVNGSTTFSEDQPEQAAAVLIVDFEGEFPRTRRPDRHGQNTWRSSSQSGFGGNLRE